MTEHVAAHTTRPVKMRTVSARRLNLLIVAVVVLTVAVLFGGFYLLDALDKVSTLANDNKDTAARNRANRLEDQAHVQQQIKQLACISIAQVPDDPRKPAIKAFRKFYGCPPYSNRNSNPFASPSPPLVPLLPTAAPTPTAPRISTPRASPTPKPTTSRPTQTTPTPTPSTSGVLPPVKICIPALGCISTT